MNDTPLEIGVPQTGSSRHEVMRRIVNSFSKERFLIVLEVGSYEGQSAVVWSRAVHDHCGARNGRVICIDPWKPYLTEEQVCGSSLAEKMNNELASGVVFERFKKNTEIRDGLVPIYFFVGTLKEKHRDHPFSMLPIYDIVFLDGAHDYESVRDDIELASKLVRIGGILCGDDLERQGDEFEPDSLKALSHLEYVSDGDYHPGVTRAVYEAARGRTWCESGVWAMKRATETVWTTELDI